MDLWRVGGLLKHGGLILVSLLFAGSGFGIGRFLCVRVCFVAFYLLALFLLLLFWCFCIPGFNIGFTCVVERSGFGIWLFLNVFLLLQFRFVECLFFVAWLCIVWVWQIKILIWFGFWVFWCSIWLVFLFVCQKRFNFIGWFDFICCGCC